MFGEPKYPDGFSHFDYVNPDAPQGGVLRQGVTGSFDSLNPFSIKGVAATGLTWTMESLMARAWDEPFSLYGLIAATVAVAPDRSAVTFTLRPEARWHDAAPITASDVLFSWQALRDHGRPNHREYYAKVDHAFATGDRQVTFVFKPNAEGQFDRELPLIMGLMPVLSEAWWRTHDVGETTLEVPLTSGPYDIAAVDPGRRITYHRRADYWGRALPERVGTDNFDEVRFDYYRDDTTALEAFNAHEEDLRFEYDVQKWTTGYRTPALAAGKVELARIPNGRPAPFRALVFNTRRPLFADVRVRTALLQAFDFEWINRSLFLGAEERLTSTFTNSELAATGLPDAAELAELEPYRAQLPPSIFTEPLSLPVTDGTGPAGMRPALRRALALLQEAGWSLQDGRLVNASTGAPFTFEILLNQPADEKIALEFARALSRLGITATVRDVDSAQYQQRSQTFDYDMTIARWVNSLSPGNEQSSFWSAQAAAEPGSRNYPGVSDPVITALAAAISHAPTRAILQARTRALDRCLMAGAYTIPLFYLPDDRVALWQGLARPANTPLYGIVLETWWWQGGDRD